MVYYIKRITMSGQSVETSFIDLFPGVNILYGSSNTGKSYVAECIDYLMGNEDNRIDDNKGYDTIKIEFDVDGSYLSMTRKLNESYMIVDSCVEGIDSGKYNIKGKNRICHVWLKLIGIEGRHRINKSAHCQREELNNRAFDHVFVLREKKIDAENSILLPSEFSRIPVTKASLLFLITGDDFDDGKNYDKPEIREAKKDAVISFADNQLKSIQEKRRELLTNSIVDSPERIEMRIEALLTEIEYTEGEIGSLLLRNKSMGERSLELDKELTECYVLENRYKSLQTQYRADLKRLSFMIEGEQLLNDPSEWSKECPFCGNRVDNQTADSCVTAAVSEVENLSAKMKDLKSVQKTLKNEIENKLREKKELKHQMDSIEREISGELRPKIQQLRSELREYSQALSFVSIKNAYETISFQIRENIDVYKSDVAHPLFKVDEYFGEKFVTEFQKIINELLIKCCFDDYRTSQFDVKSFDLIVNQTKKKSFGQGYRAFLNVILSMAMQEYLAKYGKYKPCVFVLDSPVLSLKEDVDSSNLASESMKSSLFKYIISNPCAEQIVIIENELPPINYAGVHMVKYSKGNGFWKTMP